MVSSSTLSGEFSLGQWQRVKSALFRALGPQPDYERAALMGPFKELC